MLSHFNLHDVGWDIVNVLGQGIEKEILVLFFPSRCNSNKPTLVPVNNDFDGADAIVYRIMPCAREALIWGAVIEVAHLENRFEKKIVGKKVQGTNGVVEQRYIETVDVVGMPSTRDWHLGKNSKLKEIKCSKILSCGWNQWVS